MSLRRRHRADNTNLMSWRRKKVTELLRLPASRAAEFHEAGTRHEVIRSMEKSAGRIRWGQSYPSSVAPGDHFISIMVYLNHRVLTPAEKRVSVQRGQSYMFTSRWNGDRLVLM